MQATRKYGFTLVEIMVVVVIVGLLAAIAASAFARARQASQNTRFASDVRVYSGAMETFAMEYGDFPEDSNSGAVPAGLGEYLKLDQWNEGPSLGGVWDVEKGSYNVNSAVGAHGFTVTVDQITKFDEKYDDGDLSTGKYRRLDNDRYYYVISE
ncbi:MAG: prepilin-type N-terminal cleavage/methylation domain-containing protein [Opitutales bacterium]